MRVIMSGKKIDELDAYKIYVAMKSHFQGEYDYKKFKGKTRVNRESSVSYTHLTLPTKRIV